MLSTLVTGVEPISNTIIDNITSPLNLDSFLLALAIGGVTAIILGMVMWLDSESSGYSKRKIFKMSSGAFISIFTLMFITFLWSGNSTTNNLLTLEKIEDHYGVQLTAYHNPKALKLEKGATKNIGPGRSIVNNQIWENVYIKQAKDGSFTLSIQNTEDKTVLTPLTPVP